MASKSFYTGTFTHGVERTDVPHPFPGQYQLFGAVSAGGGTKPILDIKTRNVNSTTIGVTVYFAALTDPIGLGSGSDTVNIMFLPIVP